MANLQSLADQLGVAMRNAELYSEAVQARAIAEKADQIKTRPGHVSQSDAPQRHHLAALVPFRQNATLGVAAGTGRRSP